MKIYEEVGMRFMDGVFRSIGKIFILGFIIIALCNVFGIGVDDSDYSAWDRSGFSVRTDAKTGLQYLQRDNAVIPRLDANGNHMKAVNR